MTVSNPASFSSIRAEFGGSSNFKDYYRGGPYVPASAPAQISATADGLAMSQFNGVSAYTPITSVTLSPSSVSLMHGSSGTCTATANGSGVKTYAWSKISGSGTLNISANGNTATVTFRDSASATAADTSAIFRCTVSDGSSSSYKDVTVDGVGTA